MKPTKATPLAALALTMALAACTPQLETIGIDTGTTAPRTLSVALGAKPAYTATTRTNPETGQWQAGDKVTATLQFYSHDNQPIADADGGTPTQTLTCTAPAQWSANPPIIIAPGAATTVSATYTYTSAPDPRTATVERIAGTIPNSAEGETPVIADGKVPLPPTGILALPTPTWQRLTALVVVNNIPAGSTARLTLSADAPVAGTEWDGTLDPSMASTALWQNNTATPATAHFHLPADVPADAPDAPAAPAATFSLQIDAQPATYTDVPYTAGQKYTLYANPKEPGTEGDNAQYTLIDPTSMGGTDNEQIAALTEMFNNPQGITRFAISGTGTANVEKALIALTNNGSTNKIDLLMPDVTEVWQSAFFGCTSLASISLPAAESIGMMTFGNCTALTSISLPAATDIGERAFLNCSNLTSISLPAATSIGSNAFYGCTSLASISLPAAESIGMMTFGSCTSLTRLDLTQSTKPITMNSDAFNLINIDTGAKLTLVLHSSAQNEGNAMGISITTVKDKRNVTFAHTTKQGNMGEETPSSDPITIPFSSVKDPAGNELKDTDTPAPIAMNNPKLSNFTSTFMKDKAKLSNFASTFTKDKAKLSSFTSTFMKDKAKLSNFASTFTKDKAKLSNFASTFTKDKAKLSNFISTIAMDKANETKLGVILGTDYTDYTDSQLPLALARG